MLKKPVFQTIVIISIIFLIFGNTQNSHSLSVLDQYINTPKNQSNITNTFGNLTHNSQSSINDKTIAPNTYPQSQLDKLFK